MEFITQIMGYADQLPVWVNAITALIVALKGITMLTPSKSDNAIADKVLKFINFFALNILKDKNADA